MDEGAALEEGESDADEGFEEEAAAPEPVPLDHRLPEAVSHHEEVTAPSEPPRADDGSNVPEE